jgi:hypothetical protein
MKTLSFPIAMLISFGIMFFLISNTRGQNVVAVNDTIDLTPLIPKTVNLLANDSYPPGDSIVVGLGGSGGVYCGPYAFGYLSVTYVSAGVYTYLANATGTMWNFSPVFCRQYYIRDVSQNNILSYATIVFRIHAKSYDSLYLNNINARFTVNGIHFFGPEGGKFEVPKFSGKSTIFLNSLWIGGMADTTLYLAAQRYGQGPNTGTAYSKADFFPGPVMDSSSYSVYQDTIWDYIWNLKRSEIEYHKAHWNDNGYKPIHDILTWPGNGNVSLGQAAKLAPFFDRNNDGIYNPFDGDYPLIRGDQTLFFIFNDDRSNHTESLGRKMKIEIHGMAYEWDMPEDSAFNNTVFLSYKIFNRSGRTYTNTYLGAFTDLDIGYSNDDYVGCDVNRSSYYGYNGDSIDGSGQPGAYGEHPPVQSVTFLGGPYLDPDGYDNPSYNGDGIKGPSFHGDCSIVGLNDSIITMHYGPGNNLQGQFKVSSNAITGVNFGDSIIDNERYGMRIFRYFNNSNSGVPEYMTDPYYDYDYYKFLQGIWKDNTKMWYGGNGNIYDPHSYGPYCDFMFPGLSDLCDWGTGGQPPNGPKDWTEKTAGNPPQDKRGVGSTGPFTFHPGDAEELDLSFSFARDYGNTSRDGSLSKLFNMIDIVRNAFITNTLPNGGNFNGIADNYTSTKMRVQIYPNPANTIVNVRFKESVNQPMTIRLINFNGTIVKSFEVKPGNYLFKFDVSGIPAGLYLINLQSKDEVITKKVAVIR